VQYTVQTVCNQSTSLVFGSRICIIFGAACFGAGIYDAINVLTPVTTASVDKNIQHALVQNVNVYTSVVFFHLKVLNLHKFSRQNTEQRTRIERGCLFLPGSSMGVL
jgi:hypothetical protein